MRGAQALLFLLFVAGASSLGLLDEVEKQPTVRLPQNWVKEGPFGFYRGRPFDDYEEQGKQGIEQIVFHCHNVNCVYGGIRGVETTYADKSVVSHGFAGGAKGSGGDRQVTFVVDSDAGEYITSATVFWHEKHGIGAHFKTSTGRSVTVGHQTGQSATSQKLSGHQIAVLTGLEFHGDAFTLHGLGWYQVPNCNTINKVKGYWLPLTYSSGQQVYTFTTGETHSYTKTTTRTWSRSTTESVTSGFSFMGFSMSTTISHTASYEIARQYSETFSTSTTTSSQLTFPPGQIWQWHFNVTDACGYTMVMGHDWVSSNSSLQEPCCPPGFAADPTIQHGACADPTLSVCK